MDKPHSQKLENDVMQALESLRAILDNSNEPEPGNDAIPTLNDDIPTLNTVVARPKQETPMQAMSLFDDPNETLETDTKPAKKEQKKAEEQLILPEVRALDEHHGVNPNTLSQTENTANFDDFWALLEPKIKCAAKECFQELFAPHNND